MASDVRSTDFLIIGGGVMGVTLALELKRRYPDCAITLMEKEAGFGLHASGRNSGVLHAGFYYTADSLKARFTREGNRRLTEYCRERGLALNQCGKIVVARNEQEQNGIRTLLQRGRANSVDVRHVSEEEARELEPRARTAGKPFSPQPRPQSTLPRSWASSCATPMRPESGFFRKQPIWAGRGTASAPAPESSVPDTW